MDLIRKGALAMKFSRFFALAKITIFLSMVLVQTAESQPGNEDLIKAGEFLFHSRRLSHDNQQACSSCHLKTKYFSDGYDRALSRTKTLTRNTPSLLTVDRYQAFGWDGKGASIRNQIKFALFAPHELFANPDSLGLAIEASSDIQRQFLYSKKSKEDYVLDALGAYVKSLPTKETVFDKYQQGTYQLSRNEKLGMDIFFGKGNCVSCHIPPKFTDDKFHNNGMWLRPIVLQTISNPNEPDRYTLGVDWGRADIEAGEANKAAFRTPSLINVALTGPYMHDGSLPTLRTVVDFYARGGDVPGKLKPINMTLDDRENLVHFLRLLTDANIMNEK